MKLTSRLRWLCQTPNSKKMKTNLMLLKQINQRRRRNSNESSKELGGVISRGGLVFLHQGPRNLKNQMKKLKFQQLGLSHLVRVVLLCYNIYHINQYEIMGSLRRSLTNNQSLYHPFSGTHRSSFRIKQKTYGKSTFLTISLSSKQKTKKTVWSKYNLCFLISLLWSCL